MSRPDARRGASFQSADIDAVVRMTQMNRPVGFVVYVIAVLAFHQDLIAQQPNGLQSGFPEQVPAGFIPSRNSLQKFAARRVGDAKLPEGTYNAWGWRRPATDLGKAGSSGEGFQHFSAATFRYTQWYRPRAATLNAEQRCSPVSFRPRGFSNLFANPKDCYRMEYQPYSLGDEGSIYGPSYVKRAPDARCAPECLIELE
jgi:hypothetical protein